MARIIKANGKQTTVEPKNGRTFSLKEVKEAIGGGLIEIVRCGGGATILVIDEEGLLKDLPHNQEATFLAGQLIVGDVLVCKPHQVE